MAVNWSDSETFKLIELHVWSEEGILEKLEGSKRNKHFYTRLSSELEKHEKHRIVKSGEQCRGKVKKLRQEIRRSRMVVTRLAGVGKNGSSMTNSTNFSETGLLPIHLWSWRH